MTSRKYTIKPHTISTDISTYRGFDAASTVTSSGVVYRGTGKIEPMTTTTTTIGTSPAVWSTWTMPTTSTTSTSWSFSFKDPFISPFEEEMIRDAILEQLIPG